MESASSFYVFDKWLDASKHAFGSRNQLSTVPKEDKEEYYNIYSEIFNNIEYIKNNYDPNNNFEIKTVNYSKEFGARGHRPVDLWVSLYGTKTKLLAKMPQIYIIASHRGIEIGFAASIDEADYHDPDVKARNRQIIPILNSKLPSANALFTKDLDEKLRFQKNWHFNTKTRLKKSDIGFDQYSSAADLFDHLKGSQNSSGGGTICRIFSKTELTNLDLKEQIYLAFKNFSPLIIQSSPSSWEIDVVSAQDAVHKLADKFQFDPINQEDARNKIFAEIAQRQGQAKFRKELLKAYNGKCAVTGTAVPAVLQAAHITPYLGPKTNHVTNGILLRADLHNLYDLGLIKINPDTRTIEVSASLQGTDYIHLNGIKISETIHKKQQPSYFALRQQYLKE
ncbi:HNH endonuclease [Pseudochrobactrum sp. XF203]|uniref:HNH endonuclease n=1 Tax=Pseudochrobactrum sp. XF203 TaxID=2879116 RepID=UPI001CE39F15|nr:HNH endonuclease [Pseudochrobactrum sp. XF203]UCA45108.1 HNH endonuclease [Pseudochrobactrum sp. XF203]